MKLATDEGQHSSYEGRCGVETHSANDLAGVVNDSDRLLEGHLGQQVLSNQLHSCCFLDANKMSRENMDGGQRTKGRWRSGPKPVTFLLTAWKPGERGWNSSE